MTITAGSLDQPQESLMSLPPLQAVTREHVVVSTCNLNVLDLSDPAPLTLITLFEELHNHHSYDLEFNKSWMKNIARITFCAQRIINRCDEDSRAAFDLFKAAGIKVKMPNIFQRMIYRFQRMRRAEVYKAKLTAQASRHELAIKQVEKSQLEIRSHVQIAKYNAVQARKEERVKTADIRMFRLKRKDDENKRKADNGRKIIELSEAIKERIAEERKNDGTNGKIREYNALVENGDHDLDPQQWKKMKYLPLDE